MALFWCINYQNQRYIMQTSVIRIRTSLQDSILDILNKQIAMEAHSSASYLSMSAWAYAQGLSGCGYYFKKQSGEEREHMMRLFNYITEMGGMAISPEVTGIESNFTGLRDIFLMALEMEIKITESFNNMTLQCHNAKDFQTAKFLQWYLDEQMEEEKNARRLLEIYDLIGTEDGGLYRIDKEVEKLKRNEA